MVLSKYMFKTLKKSVGINIFFFLLVTNLAIAADYQFDKNLYFGLRNDTDVVKLQDLLRKFGHFGLKTSSGNYFNMTVEAVRKFQIANNIKPASGFFGPLTRQVANRQTNMTSIITIPPVAITSQAKDSATSTYWGKIKIGDVNTNEDIKNEYLTIENVSTDDKDISITGLKLVTSGGDEFVIPKAHNLPGISAVAENNIVLRPSNSAKIFTGRQERQINFRENLCTGYFDQTSGFFGKLSRTCPRPDVRSNLKLPDHCVRVFEEVQSCRTIDTSKIQVSECLEFSEAHFNYQGCVNDFKGKKDFYSNRWLVWMQRSNKFLRNIHDEITLYDGDGKIVDKFKY